MRIGGLAAGLVIAATMLGCPVDSRPRGDVSAPADTAAGETPFRLEGPGGAALMVAVHINGQGPFDLILDTGATYTCITPQLEQQLQLPRRRGITGVGIGVGAGGAATQAGVHLVRMDSVRVGEASASGLDACVIDLAALAQTGVRVDGLLGLNYLRSFQVSLDFQRNVLTLTRQ